MCTYLHNTEGGHRKINFVVFPNVWDNLLDLWCRSNVFHNAYKKKKCIAYEKFRSEAELFKNLRRHVPSTNSYPGTQIHSNEPIVFTQAVLAGQRSL